MEKTNYKGWTNAIRLANNSIELILTADVGPRAIRFGFTGQANEFAEDEEWVGKTGDADFHTYGGHRLWHAPESIPRTYSPDNEPVKVEETPQGVILLPKAESSTGIQKEWLVRLFPSQPHVRIRHRLTNTGLWPVPLAPWAISVMAPGGVGILPFPPRRPHTESLLPTSRLAVWSYTDMTDPRWKNTFSCDRIQSGRIPRSSASSAARVGPATAAPITFSSKCMTSGRAQSIRIRVPPRSSSPTGKSSR
jgi:hypothetical protein